MTGDNARKVYGPANQSLGYTITGFVNGDTASVVSGSPTLSTSAIAASDVGTNPIVAAPDNLSASDCIFAYGNGTLSVTHAPLTMPVPSFEPT
jgi:hypothetical protein